jgi:hypothetical protein
MNTRMNTRALALSLLLLPLTGCAMTYRTQELVPLAGQTEEQTAADSKRCFRLSRTAGQQAWIEWNKTHRIQQGAGLVAVFVGGYSETDGQVLGAQVADQAWHACLTESGYTTKVERMRQEQRERPSTPSTDPND